MITETRICRVFICDDHAWLRQALTDVITGLDGFDKVGEAADGEGCLAQLTHTEADIVILDVNMPQGGPDLVRATKSIAPNARVIIYTALRNERTETALRDAGADHYLVKTGRLGPLREVLIRAATS